MNTMFDSCTHFVSTTLILFVIAFVGGLVGTTLGLYADTAGGTIAYALVGGIAACAAPSVAGWLIKQARQTRNTDRTE